jgi:hypothetical protein
VAKEAPRMDVVTVSLLVSSGTALERSNASSVSTPPSLASSSAAALPESLPLLLLSRRSISESDSSLTESDQSPETASPRKAMEEPCNPWGLGLEPLASFVAAAPLPYLAFAETLYLSPVLLVRALHVSVWIACQCLDCMSVLLVRALHVSVWIACVAAHGTPRQQNGQACAEMKYQSIYLSTLYIYTCTRIYPSIYIILVCICMYVCAHMYVCMYIHITS